MLNDKGNQIFDTLSVWVIGRPQFKIANPVVVSDSVFMVNDNIG